MRIGSEYALSLFSLAKEQGRMDHYEKDLNTVRVAIEENPQWLSVLHSPAIPIRQRLELIDTAFGDLDVKEVLSFVKLLCEKGLIRSLSDCISEFSLLKKEAEQRVPVTVRFASPLSEEQKAKLAEKIKLRTGKIPEIVYCSDPSLIGGIRVQIGDTVLDGSLSGKLSALKGVIEG